MIAVKPVVGDQKQLRNGEEEQCDTCESRATVRLTEKAGVGTCYGFYCKSCLSDAVEKLK